MKLINVITLRFAMLAVALLTCWSVLFYYAVMAEVHDETDDQLENFAEQIIIKSLTNESLPTESSGSNNQYFLHPVTPEYASMHEHVRYEDRDVYIKERKETEPARVLTYIYQRADGQYMEIEVSTPTIEKTELIEAIIVWLVLLFVTLLLVLVALNFWMVKREMKPLHRLLSWLAAYKPGASLQPLNNPTGITEFKNLNQSVSDAIQRGEDLHQQQKQFVGNASHEMQTPLAVSIGHLEMLLEDESLTEAQANEIVKVHHSLGHLSRLNRSLLLLCKIDSGQFSGHKPMNLNTLTHKYLPDYEMLYEEKGMQVQMDEQGEFVVDMDESLATTLLTNLLKNAFVHSQPNTTIRIHISSDTWRIGNSGTPEALDRNLIFTRFYHTGSSNSSTGLGLPIVQSICQHSGLTVDYEFQDRRHTFLLKRTK